MKTDLSPELAAAIDGVVLAIPQLEALFKGGPPATAEEAFERYPAPSQANGILLIWMAWRASARLRDVWNAEAPKAEPSPREPTVG